jgi:hypothetical protein
LNTLIQEPALFEEFVDLDLRRQTANDNPPQTTLTKEYMLITTISKVSPESEYGIKKIK